MTVRAGRKPRNAGSFPRKELGEALRIGPNFSPRTDGPILRRLTAPPACRALRCSLCVQAMLTQEPDSEILCRFLPKEGGLKLRRSRHLPLERQRTQPFCTTRRREAAPTCAVRRAPFSYIILSNHKQLLHQNKKTKE